VITSPAAATTEAITHGVSGLVAEVTAPADWVGWLDRLSRDDAFAERLRTAARGWVEEHFDAHRNAGVLLQRFQAALAAAPAPDR